MAQHSLDKPAGVSISALDGHGCRIGPLISHISASEVANCVVCRWKQSTRQLHRGESAGTITLRAESFFRIRGAASTSAAPQS